MNLDARSARCLPALLAAIAVVALGVGSTRAQASAPVFPVSAAAEARQARRFWTAARMESARPLSVRVSRHGARLVRLPAPTAGGQASRGYPSSSSVGGALASSTSETVAEPALSGTSQNGAVFVVLGQGEIARCSGTSVKAPNFSVVFTAGHCVHDGRHWLGRKWVFVPGYHHGQRPLGVFPARWLGTTPQWLARGNENFDVGAAVVGRNEHGQRLAEVAGADGIAWDLSPAQLFDVYGYPVAEPFDGATLQVCSQVAYEGHGFLSFLLPGPLDLAVPCEVTGGASGGGWIISGNRLNGVTTYGYSEDPLTDYGPYFGREVGRLFGRAARVR